MEIFSTIFPGRYGFWTTRGENRQKENPVLFKSRAWTLAEDAEMKENVFQRYEKLAAGFHWNKVEELPIIPVVHGTDYATALKICNTGFTTLASLDDGFYGQGIYCSSFATYIIPYFATKKRPCIILCFAIPGNVYPVTEEYDGPDTLLGKPVKKGYHSHYVVTSREGQVYKHFQNNSGSPSENGTDSEKGKEPERAESPKHKRVPKAYDEFVFFHEAQVIPAYIISLDPTNLPELLEKHQRSTPTTKENPEPEYPAEVTYSGNLVRTGSGYGPGFTTGIGAGAEAGAMAGVGTSPVSSRKSVAGIPADLTPIKIKRPRVIPGFSGSLGSLGTPGSPGSPENLGTPGSPGTLETPGTTPVTSVSSGSSGSLGTLGIPVSGSSGNSGTPGPVDTILLLETQRQIFQQQEQQNVYYTGTPYSFGTSTGYGYQPSNLPAFPPGMPFTASYGFPPVTTVAQQPFPTYYYPTYGAPGAGGGMMTWAGGGEGGAMGAGLAPGGGTGQRGARKSPSSSLYSSSPAETRIGRKSGAGRHPRQRTATEGTKGKGREISPGSPQRRKVEVEEEDLSNYFERKDIGQFFEPLAKLGFRKKADFLELKPPDVPVLGITLGLNFVDEIKLRNIILELQEEARGSSA